MTVGGETFQLSFGPAANAITSHLCNLQGLACTTSSSSDDYNNNNSDAATAPLCDPYVTHGVDNKDTYVPRVLFVDGKNCFDAPGWTSSSSSAPSSSLSEAVVSNDVDVPAWDRSVQIHHRVRLLGARRSGGGAAVAAHRSTGGNSFNGNDHDANSNSNNDNAFIDTTQSNFTSSTQIDAFANFQNVASVLASYSSTHSRYHSSRYTSHSSRFVRSSHHPSSSSSQMMDSGRHMVWDSDEEEEEEEDVTERRAMMERQQWDRREGDMQSRLDDSWNHFLSTPE